MSSHSDDGWTDERRSGRPRRSSPYFNDLVIYGDYPLRLSISVGFLTCVRSQRWPHGQWREQAYGSGQVLLLADQGLLLVVGTETGKGGVVEAGPGKCEGAGHGFQGPQFEGKTWNHPVVAHGKLFVRNGEEMACYQLDMVEK